MSEIRVFQLRALVCTILIIFFYYLSNLNPGWVSYPDSLYYLNLAIEWGRFNFVLDDGTGTFVRPLAYAGYGFAHSLGGFDGIFNFNLILCFSTIVFLILKQKSIALALSFIVVIASSWFIGYANSILLQLFGFSLVCLSLREHFNRRYDTDLNWFAVTVLIAGTLVHGGVVFVLLSYIASKSFSKIALGRFVTIHAYRDAAQKALLSVGLLILILGALELYFDERVFRYFFGERSFKNSPDSYYFGQFFVAVFSIWWDLIGNTALLVAFIFVLLTARTLLTIWRGGRVDTLYLWVLSYLLLFEIFTFFTILRRDAFSSEYYRTYFMFLPVILLCSVSNYKIYVPLVRRVGHAGLRSLLSGSIPILMLVTVLSDVYSSRLLGGAIGSKSPQYGVNQHIKYSLGETLDETKVLIMPSNVYSHRRFFTHPESLGPRAVYFDTECSSAPIEDVLNRFLFIYIITEESMLDNRDNGRLVAKHANCNPEIDLRDTLSRESFVLISKSKYGELYGVR